MNIHSPEFFTSVALPPQQESRLQMDAIGLGTSLGNGIPFYISFILCSLATFTLYIYLKPDPEAAIDYHVPAPEQCHPEWKGEILQNPSLKVPRSNILDTACG